MSLRLVVVVFVVAALVNAWRTLVGGPYPGIAHAALAAVFALIAYGLHERADRAWWAGLVAALGDTGHVMATSSPGLFGSMIWPLVALALLAMPATRRSIS